MNLFNNLKGTLTNVKSDLTSNFQPKNSAVNQEEKVPGQQLLSRYTDYWKELCLNTDSMGKQAEACDKVMTALNLRVTQKKVNILQVVSELKSLGKAVAEVETIKLRLVNINKSCEHLEEMLVDLEGLNMRCRHAAVVENMERKFNEHRKRRMREHENSKRLLAEKHRKGLEQLNEEVSRRKCERQKVFEDAHKQEMDIYRTFGNISYSFHENHPTSSPDLSTIELDDELGQMELEAFLGPCDCGPSSDRGKGTNGPLRTESNLDVCKRDVIDGVNDVGGLDADDVKMCLPKSEPILSDEIPPT